MTAEDTLGIIGSGALGGAIARGLLRSGDATPDRIILANRSGARTGFADWPDIRVTTDLATLPETCATILLALPPAATRTLTLDAGDALIVSVMAGVTLDDLARITGAGRIVRAMSNPAAEIGLAYSPWVASDAVTDDDRARVRSLFGTIGQTDEITDEAQIDVFTALTGPTPGFVALCADAMVRYAAAQGIAPGIAARAVRQLFLASGTLMAWSEADPADHVREMIDYAGTTAAGLNAAEAAGLATAIAAGLDAAVDRARTIASSD